VPFAIVVLASLVGFHLFCVAILLSGGSIILGAVVRSGQKWIVYLLFLLEQKLWSKIKRVDLKIKPFQ
jgi:hypothetical protein